MALTRLSFDSVTGTIAQLNTAVTDADIQPALVSGTSIKTINLNSILGSGDITVAADASGDLFLNFFLA